MMPVVSQTQYVRAMPNNDWPVHSLTWHHLEQLLLGYCRMLQRRYKSSEID
jgi:hypothetical protein